MRNQNLGLDDADLHKYQDKLEERCKNFYSQNREESNAHLGDSVVGDSLAILRDFSPDPD